MRKHMTWLAIGLLIPLAAACASDAPTEIARPEVAGINDQREPIQSLDELSRRSTHIAVVIPRQEVGSFEIADAPTPVTALEVVEVLKGDVPSDLRLVQGYTVVDSAGVESPLISENAQYIVFLEPFFLGRDNGGDGQARQEFVTVGGPSGAFINLDSSGQSFVPLDAENSGLPTVLTVADLASIDL